MDWQMKVLVALADGGEGIGLEGVPKVYQDYVKTVKELPNILSDTRTIDTSAVVTLFELLTPQVDYGELDDTIKGHLFLEKLLVFNKPLVALSYLREIKDPALKARLSSMMRKGTSFPDWGWGAHIETSTQARALLRENLLKLLPSDVYIATDRLQSLVSDGLKYQTMAVPSLDEETNLLHGNLTVPKLPSILKLTLTNSRDEVWFVKYSPNGKYLAAGTKDNKTIIFDAENDYSLVASVENHTNSVTHLAWSLDSQILLSLSFDLTVCLWSLKEGTLFYRIEDKSIFDYPLRYSCAQFIPNDPNEGGNYKFVLASTDGKLVVIKVNAFKANIIRQYKPIDTILPQIHDFAILNERVWTIQPNNTDLMCYSLPDLELVSVTALPATPTSVIALPNSAYLLLNFKSHSAILMNVDSTAIGVPYPETLFRMPPSASTPFVVRGCIGFSTAKPTEPALVLCGSQTGQVWIWGPNGNILTVVEGHRKLVSCLTWRPGALEWASSSDDHKICIWGMP